MDGQRLVTVIFPDGTVLKCEKLVYSAGNVERREGEWEHGHYGEFTITDINHVFEHQSQMFLETGQKFLEDQGVDVAKELEKMHLERYNQTE